jgi:hypothetical protein
MNHLRLYRAKLDEMRRLQDELRQQSAEVQASERMIAIEAMNLSFEDEMLAKNLHLVGRQIAKCLHTDTIDRLFLKVERKNAPQAIAAE